MKKPTEPECKVLNNKTKQGRAGVNLNAYLDVKPLHENHTVKLELHSGHSD